MKRKVCKNNANTILLTLKAITALIEAQTHNNGLNLATVWRNYNWCWSTYEYFTDEELGPYLKKVQKELVKMNEFMNGFNPPNAKTRDLYSDALIHYENS